MPDEGASMKDQPPVHEDDAQRRAGADHDSRNRVQDERMPEYEIDERKRESATVIERSDGQGQDDGTDQVTPEERRADRQAPPDRH
jgi:hypothetical protein